MQALPGQKPEYASLNIFKTAMSISSQPFLNLSKYKSITNCAFLGLQIIHAGVIVLSEIIYCAVKWVKFTSEILIYVNLYLS